MSKELSPTEEEVYNLIKRSGVTLTKQIPVKKAGAIPNLINKGLVEVFKMSISSRNPKKTKFIRVVDENSL